MSFSNGWFISAKDDFPDPLQTKSAIDSIKHLRLSKLNASVKKLKRNEDFVLIRNISDYEINLYRNLLGDLFDKLTELNAAAIAS